MNVRIKFLGGAQSVTGSKYLVEADDFKVLVDCGLFQGLKELRERNWADFPTDPRTINAVIITHAHIDHIGFLPKLYKDGFRGPIYCTAASKDLAKIMLLDAAKLQEEEAEYAFKKGYSKHDKPQPLYTTEDVEDLLPFIEGYRYNQRIKLSNKIAIKFHDAGHILGSAITELFLQGDKMRKKIVFSGDIGRYNKPMLRNPAAIKDADFLLIESTYGNKENPQVDPKDKLAEVINEAFAKNGCLLIPAFAVGRTQMLLYYIRQLIEEKRIPAVPVFVDSPMAINVTSLYQRHQTFHTIKETDSIYSSIFEFPTLNYYRSQADSVAINNIRSNAIIISSSGMCNGGRILHHLFHRLPRNNDTVLFVGYQAEGTRGRKIVEGDKKIKILGEEVDVNCNIVNIGGLSAHADKNELFKWMSNFKDAPKNTFIIHGEPETQHIFADNIKSKLGWNTYVPEHLETYELFKGI